MARKFFNQEEKPEEETFFSEDDQEKDMSPKKEIKSKKQGVIVMITKTRMIIDVGGLGYESPVDPTKRVGDTVDV